MLSKTSFFVLLQGLLQNGKPGEQIKSTLTFILDISTLNFWRQNSNFYKRVFFYDNLEMGVEGREIWKQNETILEIFLNSVFQAF